MGIEDWTCEMNRVVLGRRVRVWGRAGVDSVARTKGPRRVLIGVEEKRWTMEMEMERRGEEVIGGRRRDWEWGEEESERVCEWFMVQNAAHFLISCFGFYHLYIYRGNKFWVGPRVDVGLGWSLIHQSSHFLPFVSSYFI